MDELEKTCGCGAMRVKIGEDAKEQLEIIPAQFFVRRTIRLRYACPQCGSCAAGIIKADKVGKIPTWAKKMLN